MKPEILRVHALYKRFGPVEVLRGVDLSLNQAEVLALVGDNGAGKSTLIKNISGVYQPDAGEIYLSGQTINVASPREARALGIETVYQDLALAEDLTVGANIFLGREPVRRLLGFLPIINNRAIRTETDQLLALGRTWRQVAQGDQRRSRRNDGDRVGAGQPRNIAITGEQWLGLHIDLRWGGR